MEGVGVRVVYAVAVIAGASLGTLLWRNREKKGALPLCIANVAAAFWAFGLFLSTVQLSALALAGIKFLYLPVGIATAAALIFVFEYTGRERYVTRTTIALLAIHPVFLAVFSTLNPGKMFFTDLQAKGVIGVSQGWGPAFWAHSVYSYAIITLYGVVLIGFVYRTRHTLYRGQAAALVAGTLAPVPFNLLYLSDLVAIDTTPIGFIIGVSCYTIAIVRYEYTNITPVAREKVIANVRDGMLIVDTDQRILDSNPAAREMLGIRDAIVGSAIPDILDVPESKSVYRELTAEKEPSERTVSYGGLDLRIEATPVFDDRNRHVGWLFLLEDVTEQKRRERDLQQQIEKLDQFASLVSHDLRNPINVASGYIHQTKATGELEHLDKAEEATERMEAIIDDVLALAREGQDVTDPAPISLEATAHEAWTNVKTEDASLFVERDLTIVADGKRLKRLFENLFRNAIEHGSDPADPGGPDSSALTVTVGVVTETSTQLTLFVADDGLGFPVQDVDKLFEDGFTTGKKGTGLGLAIVEQIVHAHGWKVTAVSPEAVAVAGDPAAASATNKASPSGARFEIAGIDKSLTREQ